MASRDPKVAAFGRRGLLRAAVAGTASLAGARGARAQAAYPIRAITLVVPWGPGGSTDVIGRIMAQRFSTDLGVPVIVENRPGANGTIGTSSVARARPDGYTILVSTSSTYAMAPHLMDIPYDNERALAPIGHIGSVPMMILVRPDNPSRDLAGFIALAKAARPPMTYASAGTGSSTYLATEMFLRAAGLEMPEVAYRSGPATTLSVVQGENQMLFMSTTNGLAVVRSGQLRALAVATPQRHPLMPEIPTFAEQGFPGFEAYDDIALFAPAGTPDAVVRRLNEAMVAALRAPEAVERFNGFGLIAVGGSPEAFPAYFTAENAKWRELIRARNIRIQ